ncbi:uncharacterized protein LOC110825662 [Carica papaya]|uniref:uncharacterized protein LOC110825662 n=1 Tax=Carica papaya TaxID=3649 RepID=UPI000B8CB3E5|nr:uncharacterized protein LOC110825662 [Carica papaya]XP_021911829.1 uncharacterized protein LOC110825662 [Carica papaya]
MQDGGSILWELDKEGFPRLKHLHLNNSPKIRYIVNSMEEPWFSSNAFPVLESLFVQNLINLEKICHGKLRVGCFSKLRKVKVGNCQKLERLFPLSVFKSLLQLEEIEITDCENIAGIVTEERVVPSVDNETSEIELRQLRSLTLQNLQKLVSFHYKEQLSPTFQSRTSNSMLLLDEKILFHSLEDLKLSSVNIAKIWPDQSSAVASCLKKLKTLTLEGCDNLKYVFSSSMVKNILQLKTLVVRDCKSVEKIIVTERLHDERNMNELFFPELYDLRLENLPQLTGFCARSLTDFPSLRWLVIKKCPELESFTSNTARDQRILAAESQREAIPLFNEKVKLPNLERLLIEEMDNLEKLWNSQLAPDAFSKLDYFAVWNCKKLLTVFPSNMINRLQRLDRMRVHLCPSLKSIFEPLGAEHPESRSAIPKFVFPQVTVLEIWDIPELRSIYPGMHTTEWPLLKRMHLHGCDKVNVFASGAPWFLQTQRGEQTEISNQQPLFLVDEETFPNLEELKLQRIDAITEIWHGKFSAAYLCKLKVLELTDFLKRPILPSLSFIQLLPALEKLNISEAPFESIFQSRECARDEMLAGRLTKLSELKLSKLPDLKHLLKEEDEPGLVLPCLRPEQVESITFKNLTVLEVSKCGRLVSLVRQCTARSLVQLQKLRISDCEMIEGIIVYLGGEVKDGIVLKKLKSLELHCLPSLGSFCFGDYPLEFPSLEEVIIRGCPRMKFFSQGALSTPNLQRVQLTEGDNEGNWNGDLNTTIKQMSSEMVGYNSLEHLKLSMFPELVEMWSRSPSIPFNFKTLKFLEVQNCNNLRYLMCPSMIHSLDQLEELKIENCALMENVITAEDAGEITGVKLAFPLLNSISLESLPNLTSFCLGSNDLECLSLEKITIRNCPKLITFSSVFLKEQDLGVTGDGNIESSSNGDADNPVTSLFREKAVLPKLKEVVISHIDNLEQIWNNYISATSLSELKIVKVQNCPKLSTVFPAVAARSLLQLEQLLIGYCGVEYIVSKLEGDETAFLNFVFPQVSSVELRTLPELKSFYPSKHTTEWPKLKRLDVYHCEKLWLYSPEYAIQSYEDGRLNVPDLQMPLVLVEKVLPNLETMSLKEEDIAMISYSNISPADLFRKAKFLLVQCFHGESAVVPLDFLERIHDVEKLGIGCSYFPELIPYRGGGKYTGIFTRIRNLRLDTLPWIQHVGIRGSQFESALQNLEILEVWFCDGLTSLTPSSVSFPNLKSLDIWQCKSLKTLVTFSAARRLVQLTEMRIRESGMLREMISTEGGEPEEEIVFGKLRCIELDDLSSLYCFCSSNCRLKFPALEEMIVNKCYGFVIFCKGVLSTPLLSRVWLKTEYDEWRWEGDLNATVNILYQERLAAGTSDRRHIQ